MKKMKSIILFLYKFAISKSKFNLLTFAAFIPIMIAVGLSLFYRFPMRFMLAELDISMYYPLFNLIITLCSITIIANIIGKQVRSKQLYLAIFFAFFSLFLFWFGCDYYRELYTSLIVFFIHLPLVWSELKNIWSMLVGNRITMGPAYGTVSYCKPPADSTIGGGGAGSSTGASGGSGSGELKQANASRPQPSSSGDNTMIPPETAQYKLDSIPPETTELLKDPVKLSEALDTHLSILGVIENLPDKVKTDITREAEALSPSIQEVHHQIPQKKSILQYWHYRIVNAKAIKQVKIVELLEQKGYKASLETKVILDNHKDVCNGIRNASFYSMKQIYGNELNSRDKKFIRRHMDDYVTGDSPSDVD